MHNCLVVILVRQCKPDALSKCHLQELPTRTRKEEKIANLDAELFPGFVRSSSLAKQQSHRSRRTHSIAASRGLSHISQLTGSMASLGSLASNMSEKEKKSRFLPTKKRTAQLKQQVCISQRGGVEDTAGWPWLVADQPYMQWMCMRLFGCCHEADLAHIALKAIHCALIQPEHEPGCA